MPRMIRHDATGPIRIDPQDKPIFVCACGLSQKFPLCDGTHKGCKDEQPGKVYVYDAERKKVIEERDEAQP
ncbi:MAG: CDGSH iron-sulfur domain-containing protein [Phycisphaeraceae bacterium]|nr:CDGSH iron-sulfur domain-containing protein [Phycisphaeraceae bacterium]MCW5763311.1 CDGSH iron-sulfur domain-containing protein [Phycisphaeraceae bacterium]